MTELEEPRGTETVRLDRHAEGFSKNVLTASPQAFAFRVRGCGAAATQMGGMAAKTRPKSRGFLLAVGRAPPLLYPFKPTGSDRFRLHGVTQRNGVRASRSARIPVLRIVLDHLTDSPPQKDFLGAGGGRFSGGFIVATERRRRAVRRRMFRAVPAIAARPLVYFAGID